jgi:hypothetical protein
MRSLFRPPTLPSPPDVAAILKDVQQILGDDKALLALIELLSNQFTQALQAAVAHFDARLDQIEAELNPVLAPTALQFWSVKAMAVVTSISPLSTALSEIVVQDTASTPNNLAPGTITWTVGSGEAAVSDMTSLAVADADGLGFDFQASAIAPTESFPATATWTDPAGVAASVSAVLTINLVAAAPPPPPPVTALQFNLTKGT